MRSAASTLEVISPAHAAELLRARGVGLLAVETDEGMAEHLARTIDGLPYRAKQLPADYAAVRQELRRLWGESERKGRSAECARYATASQRT